MNPSDFDDLDNFPVVPAAHFTSDEFVEALVLARQGYEKLAKTHQKAIGTMPYLSVAKEMVRSKGTASALFRRASDANEILSLTWLSRARETSEILCQTNCELSNFDGLVIDDLAELRDLAPDPRRIRDLKEILAKLGVILLYEPVLPGMKLDGACFRVSQGNPVISLSLRYSRYDYFWFSLMHELAHILVHFDSLDDPILDNFDVVEDDPVEAEANSIAANVLISRSDWRSCPVRYKHDEKTLKAFAEEIGSHPFIVAGRLHRETNNYKIFGELVNQIDVREILEK